MTTASAMIAAALDEVGTVEQPPFSNRTPYAALAGHANGQPWCATFLVAMAHRIGLVLPSESAFTPTMALGFQHVGRWHTADPQPGDIVFYDFSAPHGEIDHVGLVVSLAGGVLRTIEGNTSPGTKGSQNNGGGVWARTRSLSDAVGFGRPDYTAATEDPDMTDEQSKMLSDTAHAVAWLQGTIANIVLPQLDLLEKVAARNDAAIHELLPSAPQ